MTIAPLPYTPYSNTFEAMNATTSAYAVFECKIQGLYVINRTPPRKYTGEQVADVILQMFRSSIPETDISSIFEEMEQKISQDITSCKKEYTVEEDDLKPNSWLNLLPDWFYPRNDEIPAVQSMWAVLSLPASDNQFLRSMWEDRNTNSRNVHDSTKEGKLAAEMLVSLVEKKTQRASYAQPNIDEEQYRDECFSYLWNKYIEARAWMLGV